MDLTREERMRSRMRGAARHQVENVDFGDLFTIPVIAPGAEAQPEREPGPTSSVPTALSSEPAARSPVPPTAKHVSPNTSAKRKRLGPQGTAAPVPQSPSPAQLQRQSSSATRRSPRLSRSPASNDPDGLANAPAPPEEHESLPPKPTPPSRTSASRAPDSRSVAPLPAALHSSPLPMAQHAEEIGESPADQPGSGQRRRVRPVQAVTSSALLQSALRADDYDTLQDMMPSSSPLTRKSRKSVPATTVSAPSSRTGLRRSSRLSSSSDGGARAPSSDVLAPGEDTNPPEAPNSRLPSEDDAGPVEVEESVVGQRAAADHPRAEGAHAVDDAESTRHPGSEHQRRSKAFSSPELVSEEPSAKRPRTTPHSRPKERSLAGQKQLRASRAKPHKQKPVRARPSRDATEQSISVKIQRLTKPRRLDEDDPEAEDILNTEIPFANRGGVNAVDVLAQMCEELINSGLQKLQDTFDKAQDAATKKELRVKLRALEAFQEELRTRLLEQTIALDALYALKRRVREAQKSKLHLRERIIQIRAEREQVALRMDAVRIKHEGEGKEALHNINLSAAMHDVDLAIEEGRATPELSAKGQKAADLANLELRIERVREQACGQALGGGNLRCIRSFNAFLERAVTAL